MLVTLPGTTMVYDERAGEDTFALIRPMITATGGLSLSQLSKLTGIEGSTIQNWVKRGWVAPSDKRKYGERSVVRVLIINILKGTLKLEDIAVLMKYVNGDVVDSSDDLIDDTALYNLLCSIIYEVDAKRLRTSTKIGDVIREKLPSKLNLRDQIMMKEVLYIMVQSALAGLSSIIAQTRFRELKIPAYYWLSNGKSDNGKLS